MTTELPPSVSPAAARSPRIARRSRPRAGFLAAGLVVAAGAGLVACGDDADGDGSPPESFYAGLEDSLLDEGLSADLATCFVDAVRAVGPTADDVSYFEENDDFPVALADELDALTSACLEPGEGGE